MVEYHEGPVNSSQRVIGLGGAFVSVGEGADAHLVNPAAFALRSPFFGNDWFDWDVALSVFSVLGGENDLDQSRHGEALDLAQLGQIGFNVKLGRLGLGFHMRSQDLRLRVPGGGPPDPVTAAPTDAWYAWVQRFGGLGLAWALDEGQLVLGTVLSLGTADLAHTGSGAALHLSSQLEFGHWGLVWAPRGEPWRAGLALRMPVTMRPVDALGQPVPAPSTLGALVPPAGIRLPWQVAVGASWMRGARPYNLRPSYGALPLPAGATAAEAIPRDYLLLSADLVLTGPGAGALAAQSYLAGVGEPARYGASVSLRAGAEREWLPDRLTLRAGSYYDPSRYTGELGRLHLTGGLDLRLTLGWKWRLGWCFDVASRYRNTAFGLGFWH
jgi:hypothetical protein